MTPGRPARRGPGPRRFGAERAWDRGELKLSLRFSPTQTAASAAFCCASGLLIARPRGVDRAWAAGAGPGAGSVGVQVLLSAHPSDWRPSPSTPRVRHTLTDQHSRSPSTAEGRGGGRHRRRQPSGELQLSSCPKPERHQTPGLASPGLARPGAVRRGAVRCGAVRRGPARPDLRRLSLGHDQHLFRC
jgi:hypothetical protein